MVSMESIDMAVESRVWFVILNDFDKNVGVVVFRERLQHAVVSSPLLDTIRWAVRRIPTNYNIVSFTGKRGYALPTCRRARRKET